MNTGMKMKMKMKKVSFFTIQDGPCVDTVKDFWEDKRTEAFSRIRGTDVVLLSASLLLCPSVH